MADVLLRLIILLAGAVFGFLFFGPLGAFIGALLATLVMAAMKGPERNEATEN